MIDYSLPRRLTLLFAVLAVCGFGFRVSAQDAYHAGLQARLMDEYDLPAGEWLFGDTEAIVRSHHNSYGLQRSYEAIDNQDFSEEVRLNVTRAGTNPWNAAFLIRNQQPIQLGEKLLWAFTLRSNGGGGQVSFFLERDGDFAKEVFATVPIDINWQTFFVAVEATLQDYDVNELKFGFHVAHQVQDVRVGGFTALKYDASLELDRLPSDLNNDDYDGSEADAPWRAEAQQRIEQFRMADLTVRALSPDGTPQPNVAFDVDQERHAFGFGTAMKACRLAANNCRNRTFQSRVSDLDGRGHGFNLAVFENDLKWPAWEQTWFVSNADAAEAAQWLRDRDMEVRGHNLVWPGFDNMPDDVRAMARDTGYVLDRIRGHMSDLADFPGIGDNIAEWDVLNETVTNVTLANAFRGQGDYTTGRELYVQIFEEAARAFPDAGLYLNDYVSISLNNRPTAAAYVSLKRNAREIVEAGAPIDGIGFQAHIGNRLNGIPSVLDTWDDFYGEFGLDAKVTEFDIATNVGEDLAAKYLGDFLTATFSHESMTGFVFWNFWDTDTWLNPSANLFRADWSRTPAGDVFVDKVFDEWWTDETVVSETDGTATVRAFKGRHTITYTCGGETVTQEVELGEDMTVEVTCADFASSVGELTDRVSVTAYPNPSEGEFTLTHDFARAADVSCLDALGRVVWSQAEVVSGTQLSPKLAPGTYTLLVASEEGTVVERLVIE